MIIGFLAALGAAAVYPLMFLLYGQVANTLIEYGKDDLDFNNLTTTVNPQEDKCIIPSREQQDYDNKISEIANYYVLLGFITLLMEYVAHVTWNSASERQINKMRYFLYQFK